MRLPATSCRRKACLTPTLSEGACILTRSVGDLCKNSRRSKAVAIFAKVRSTGKLIRSKLDINNGSTKLILLEDEYGISPGQACVFYSKDELGDKVLGGGWITKN